MASNGVEGLSLRKVALKARVSATALYSHFRHKRELLAVLATQGFDQLSLAMESEARAAAGTSDAADFDLPALARGYLNFSLDNAAMFQLMFGREVGNLLDFPDLVDAGARCYSIMAECVARDLRESGSQDSPDIAATAAWSMVHGLSTLVSDGRVSAKSCGVISTQEMVQQVCQTLTFYRGAQ